MSWPVFDFSSAAPYRELFDYVARTDGLPTYIGFATCGVPTSSPRWKIRKFTYDANNQCTSILYANGDVGFNATWDNRATYTYS